ncbi:MAG: hypothetical protein ABIJ97_14735 [Bacteroidota bacterium]
MKIFLLFMATVFAVSVYSQSVFVVQNATNSSVHQILDSALYYAADDDYIYLPGGNFNVGNVRISKKLNIIGAGHYPDSTQATGATAFTGNIYFKTGSDGSTLQGIYLNGDIFMGDSCVTGNVSNILISRCNINKIFLTYNTTTTTNCGAQNIFVKECVVRSNIRGANAQNVVFENNIIAGGLGNFDGNANFKNNVFMKTCSTTSGAFGYQVLYYVYNCTFENNIFKQSSSLSSYFAFSTTDNLFNNNVFGFPSCFTGAGSCNNCLYDVNFINQFVNVPGTAFEYPYNYHLSDTSVAIIAGTNGTDCGIYGGDNPYKEGAVPVNPHIQFKQIPSATDSQGKLNIQVKVSAQEN